MKKLAWSLGLLIMGSAVAGSGSSGCTVTVSGDDGGGVEPIDSGAEPDTSTGVDAGGTDDTGTGEDADAAPDTGGTCASLSVVSFGSATCDTCIGASCCQATDACFTGAESQCADLVSCFADCLAGNADAGVAPGDNTTCKTECEGGSAMPTFDDWVTCVTTQCASSCQ